MKTEYKQIMPWGRIKDAINPTLRRHFIKTDNNGAEIVDMDKYSDAEQSVSLELKRYIPCFNNDSRGLTRIWASMFNFTYIGLCQEKNEQSYSQITINFNKAMEFLESEEAKQYCIDTADDEITASSFIRFGKLETTNL
jgi:hypothetical protein